MPEVPMDVLRIVYDLANGNELNDDECDTEEMRYEAHRQHQALDIVHRILMGESG